MMRSGISTGSYREDERLGEPEALASIEQVPGFDFSVTGLPEIGALARTMVLETQKRQHVASSHGARYPHGRGGGPDV
jgi:hypothetical protein